MEQVSFAMGLIPMAREFTPMIQPFLQDQTFGYQGPAGLRIIGDATKPSQQAAQGELTTASARLLWACPAPPVRPASGTDQPHGPAGGHCRRQDRQPGALLFGYQGK